jgi:hypothetical protein
MQHNFPTVIKSQVQPLESCRNDRIVNSFYDRFFHRRHTFPWDRPLWCKRNIFLEGLETSLEEKYPWAMGKDPDEELLDPI